MKFNLPENPPPASVRKICGNIVYLAMIAGVGEEYFSTIEEAVNVAISRPEVVSIYKLVWDDKAKAYTYFKEG